MCVACIEYIKDRLTFQEFSSALREVIATDEAHAKAVADVVRQHAGNPDELKKQLELLAQR